MLVVKLMIAAHDAAQMEGHERKPVDGPEPHEHGPNTRNLDRQEAGNT